MNKKYLEGLTSEAAKKRLEIYGENIIIREKKVNPIKIFINQFKSPIILLLIISSFISLILSINGYGEFLDSILILTIVFISAISGFVQDYKAEKIIESLKKISSPKCKVIRDGKIIEIYSRFVVPGDIVLLEGGDIVPADCKILEGKVQVNESILTGESKAVNKKEGDLVYMGCYVYSGKALAEVISTGMNTKLGKIAGKLQELEEEETPFQEKLKIFTRKLVILTISIIIVTFIIGITKFSILDAFLIAISLAVAAVPENLPAVVTIALSIGAKEMAKRNALVRRLSVTESIGSVNVICTDKTGTITKGEMSVRDVWVFEKSEKVMNLVRMCCFLCNNARKIENKWIGDETDIALKKFCEGFNVTNAKRIGEIHFTSERKMMSVLYEIHGKNYVFSKGAAEILIEKCNFYQAGDKVLSLDSNTKNKILKVCEEFSSKGYRVIGLAYKEDKTLIEENLIFLGIVILYDPPREGVREAIEECYSAGIRIMMITGDNPLTAMAIAKEVGIKTEGYLTGKDLDKIDDETLSKFIDKGVNVFARVDPFHKLRILEVLKKKGFVVAMTGDGVNDCLALKRADVGIAMGKRGTEVAKEASDIILLDDNFVTIKNAVKEGRRIFDNIRKFVDYLLTCNVAEVLVVLFSVLFFPFIILYPAQILWINFVTDGFPAIALAMDKASPNVMRRPPRKIEEGIIDKKTSISIGIIGIVKSLILILTFLIVFSLSKNLDLARATLFTGFIVYEFVRIGVIRYEEYGLKIKEWFNNKFLIFSLIFSLFLQVLIIYTPLNGIFKVVPIGMFEWSILLIGALVGFVLGVGIQRCIRYA